MDIFFLKIVGERMQPEKDDEGQDLHDGKPREEKGKQRRSRIGETKAEDLILGKGHHERKHRDEITRREQKPHIGAHCQRKRGNGTGDCRERYFKRTRLLFHI